MKHQCSKRLALFACVLCAIGFSACGDIMPPDTSSTPIVSSSSEDSSSRVDGSSNVDSSSSEDNVDKSDLAYSVNTDGKTCTITGIGTCTDTEINIPEQIDGYTVTSIGEKAFENCSSLKEITIPSTVQTIGAYAFYGSGLTSAIFEDAKNWNNFTYTYTAPNEYGVNKTITYIYDLSNSAKAAAALKGAVKLCTSGEYRGETDDTGKDVLTYYYTTFNWYQKTWTKS